MRRELIKTITFIFVIVLCFNNFSISSHGKEASTEINDWPSAPKINGVSAILIDAKSGAILYDKKSSKKMYPASITKILTALITLETCKLDDTVTFSYDAVHSLPPGAAHIAINEEEQVSVENCLYGLMLASANDVANGLAEHIAGSNKAFGKLMTERAKKAGVLNSNFTNPSGLHDKDHYTTAYDMAMITCEALKIPDFLTICGTTSYTIPPTNKSDLGHPLNNKHRMLWPANDDYDDRVLGGKTGYTEEAGNTLVTYASNDDLTLICVVLDSKSGKIYEDTKSLLDYGFNSFKSIDISTAETRTFTNDTISYSIPNESVIVLPKDASLEDAVPSLADGPIDKHSQITILNYTYDQHPVGSCKLISSGKSSSTSSSSPAPISSEKMLAGKGTESYTFMKIISNSFYTLFLVLSVIGIIIGIISIRFYIVRKRRRRDYRKELEYRRSRNRRPI